MRLSPAQAPPRGPTAFDALPPDCLERVVELGFIAQLDPFFDSIDLLRQAATLACVGNAGCTAIARLLFAHLSPRFGMELPFGVTERSTAKQLKEALKAWGLPVGGSKADLWERLQDEVRDSEEDEEGTPPKHCIVSGATRRQLAHGGSKRVSHSQAMKKYFLSKWHLSQLEFVTDERKSGGDGAKLYLLSDVKRMARDVHPQGYRLLVQQQFQDRDKWEKMKEDSERARHERCEALRAELVRRGRSAEEAEAAVEENPGLSRVTWGTMSHLPVPAAANHLERMHFCVDAPDREELFALYFEADPVPPKKNLSKYKAKEQRLERAARAVMRWFVSTKGTLQQLRDDAEVPASLLPELERLWQAAHGGAAGGSGAGGAGTSSAAGAGPFPDEEERELEEKAFHAVLEGLFFGEFEEGDGSDDGGCFDGCCDGC